MSSKAGETGEDNWNTGMIFENKPEYGRRSQSPRWWIGVAAVCLGLFLLIVIFSVTVHNANKTCHPNTPDVGLIHCEQQMYNLSTDKENLREELQQLQISYSVLTKEMEVLRNHCKTVAESRDHMQQEVQILAEGLSRAGAICSLGWVKFNNKCYFASDTGQAKSWQDSRKDCLQRRADLVQINSKEELDFVKSIKPKTWIGLSDSLHEGKWRWVDGSSLIGTGFWNSGEPNNAGEEDCVEISQGGWNDVLCSDKLQWICED